MASCDYWAPARPPADLPSEVQPDFTLALDKTHNRLTGTLSDPAQEGKSECGDDLQMRWGIPSKSGPKITTLIAVVPDPVRTNALQFDRTIDALMGAAGENNYVSSYYWLPWKEQSTQAALSEESQNANQDQSKGNGHEPGLVVLKYVPQPTVDPHLLAQQRLSIDDVFARVLYIFLVAETPTTGIDGLQIQKAFQYQNQLNNSGATVQRSVRCSSNLAIIGPTFSGSAASLRQAIESRLGSRDGVTSISVNSATGTEVAMYHMAAVSKTEPSADRNCNDNGNIVFRSFSYDSSYTQNRLLELLTQSNFEPARVAVLVEDGTAFGKASAGAGPLDSKEKEKKKEDKVRPYVISFPRGISLLRNAQAENGAGAQASNVGGSPPSPYLHLSLKDANSYDSVPQFSRENTPLSQEAQLMAIARQLQRLDAQYVVISATSILDQLFLAQFLHRACPDARLVFYTGDLLFEREIDNVPFIGSITITPYPLFNTEAAASGNSTRAYSDSVSEAYFNAASYTFSGSPLKLAGYGSTPPLWVTAIGSDGYYPLGIATDQAVDRSRTRDSILPPVSVTQQSPEPELLPTHLWYFLCLFVCAMSICHCTLLCVADPWSPLTRELAFAENDQPRRRAMYVQTGTVMLCCMAVVIAVPIYTIFQYHQHNWLAVLMSTVTLLMGIVTLAVTFWKTWNYIGRVEEKKPQAAANLAMIPTYPQAEGKLAIVLKNLQAKIDTHTDGNDVTVPPGQPVECEARAEGAIPEEKPQAKVDPSSWQKRFSHFLEQNVYFIFNLVTWITLLAVSSLWVDLCFMDQGAADTSHLGQSFSFRCVHPGSGLSPIVPVLLLLLSWYIWAVFQTLRLRFSENSRPILPGRLALGTSIPLYVADESLCECDSARSGCLYKNITCLLMTREVLRRLGLTLRKDYLRHRVPSGQQARPDSMANETASSFQEQYVVVLNIALAVLYLVVFGLFVRFIPVTSLDGFLWDTGGYPTPYELLVRALFFPLLFVTLTGWIRLILIWGALRQNLLERLENQPIRDAFSRLKAAGWMTMLRRGGMNEQWRDMARSAESMRQMAKDPELDTQNANTKLQNPYPLNQFTALETINSSLNNNIETLVKYRSGEESQSDLNLLSKARKLLAHQSDDPVDGDDIGLVLMNYIEIHFAAFSEVLLRIFLVPYWTGKSSQLVESDASKSRSNPKADEPMHIRVAEEFLAIRYLALIRAVLANMRYLMTFVSLSFVLAIVAWNSYPFEPRQFIDWIFTGMLAVLGGGIIIVFAQMHRDPILSRITHTKANELGTDFYIRIIAFGAVPVLTWLAYQFPGIGTTIFKLLKPGIEVIK
jgi:hypothetical protein